MNGPREFVTQPGQLDDIAIPAVFRATPAPQFGTGPSIETSEAEARPAKVRAEGPQPRLFLNLAFFDVDETLPDAELDVVVLLDDDAESIALGYYDGLAWCHTDGSEIEHRVTHWAGVGVPSRVRS